MKIEFSRDAVNEIVISELNYWIKLLKDETNGPHKDDNKTNKRVIKACRTLLKFYEADEE